MPPGRSARFLATLAVLAALCLLAGLDAARRQTAAGERFAANRSLARWLSVTDPCIFTEARYTRHPSQADLHSPFQDHPLAMEHFPSGSLVPPPEHLAGSLRRRPGDPPGSGGAPR